MQDNKISFQFDQNSLNSVFDAIEILEGQLNFLVDLNKEERAGMARFGEAANMFMRQALDVTKNHPDILPRGFDEEELANDFELYQQLRSIETRLSPLMHKLEDTIAAAGNDAYLDSLAVYGYAKSNDKGEGLENVVNSMKRYFNRRPRKSE